ncbi:MAG: carboxylating nicotinate-nucleotide diphosphorylase [Acidobacteriota bacterium]
MTPDPLGAVTPPTLDPEHARREVRRFLAEDIGHGDVTTLRVVPSGATARGVIVAREAAVIAGLPLAEAVFDELDRGVRFSPAVAEGTAVSAGAVVARLEGPAAPILTGERLALNLLQRLSGVATITRRYVDEVSGTGASVSDTRKTTPGLRLFEKYAVRIGGGRNHRIGLFDAVLIKDNHVTVAGSVRLALELACSGLGQRLPVQVEVDGLGQLTEALECGAHAVLLDNMAPAIVAEAVQLIRHHPAGASCWIEASGGITLQNIRAYAEAGVDTISVGALTHSARAVDLALDLEIQER